ncbi:Aminodeoxychorismate synthase [Paramyrothecium foliicola]|nr:Aminodeoxychorismate synthase [Paramyrothecium foliicola]
MSALQSRMGKDLREWGTRMSDFQVSSRILGRHASRKPGPKKLNKGLGKKRLAKGLDEFSRFWSDTDEDVLNHFEHEGPDLEAGINCMTFTKDQAQTLIEEMRAACGPTPALESVSETHQMNIRRHDEWYKSILDNIFKALSCFSDDNLNSSPFHESGFRWLCANANTGSQQAILDVLLHPHVRSFRNRAVLGSGDWSDAFCALETFSLTDQASQVPAIIGTYALYGRRRAQSALSHDMVYIGQAGSLSGLTDIGMRRRAHEHQGHILRRKQLQHQARQSAKRNPNDFWVYRRITHDDIAEVSLAILTVLPYPRYFVHNASFHVPFLLTLAEAIDTIYLRTVSPSNSHSPQAWGGLYAHQLRPCSMPHSPFEGLNRAFPLKQPITQFGSIKTRRFWTPAEVLAFIDTIADNQDQIYCDPAHGTKWDHVVELLSQQGISMSKKEVRSLYMQPTCDPASGLVSSTVYMWQRHWNGFVAIKEFLQLKNLVIEPKDENDLFYHIPEFEHTQKHVEGRQTGFSVLLWSWSAICLIWYQVRAQLYADRVPPDRIPLSGPLEILKLWRAAVRDGSLYTAEILPSWTYDPLQDPEVPRHISNTPEMVAALPEYVILDVPGVDDHASGLELELTTENQGVSPENKYDWPSDLSKYRALVLSWTGCDAIGEQNDATGNDATDSPILSKKMLLPPLAMGKLHVSSLRVLICIMRDYHQRTFDESTESDLFDLSDEEFWQSLYIGGLDNSWGINDVERLRSRFGWVLDLIRDGQMPPEASLVERMFREVFADSPLKSTQHPYTYDVGYDAAKYLNPDLSPHWVENLLKSTNTLPAIKVCLQKLEVDIGCDWIFSAYGLLIAHVWEEHMFEHDYGESLSDPHSERQRSSGVSSSHSRASSFDGDLTQLSVWSAQQKPDGRLTDEAPCHIQHALSSDQDLVKHVGEMAEPRVIPPLGFPETMSARKRSAADQAPAVPKRTRARSDSRVEQATIELTTKSNTTLYELPNQSDVGDDIGNQPAEESEYETSVWTEVETGVGIGPRSFNSEALAHRNKSLAWNQEEVDFLKTLLSNGTSWASASTQLNERFGTNRNQESIMAKARRIDIVGPNRRLWTKEQDKLITDVYQEYRTRSSRMTALRETYGLDRTESSIDARARFLELSHGNKKRPAPVQSSSNQALKRTKTEAQPWTQEEDSLLQDIHQQYLDWPTRASEFNKRSKRSRTSKGLQKRTSILKLESKAKCWTDNEDESLRIILQETKDWSIVLEKFHGRHGSTRSLAAIKRRVLRIAALPIKDHVVWTVEEMEFLMTHLRSTKYRATAQEFATMFGTVRSEASVVHKLQRLQEQHGTKENAFLRFTDEEIAVLMSLTAADLENDDWVAKYHRKFGPSRNRKALLEKRRLEMVKQGLLQDPPDLS